MTWFLPDNKFSVVWGQRIYLRRCDLHIAWVDIAKIWYRCIVTDLKGNDIVTLMFYYFPFIKHECWICGLINMMNKKLFFIYSVVPIIWQCFSETLNKVHAIFKKYQIRQHHIVKFGHNLDVGRKHIYQFYHRCLYQIKYTVQWTGYSGYKWFWEGCVIIFHFWPDTACIDQQYTP